MALNTAPNEWTIDSLRAAALEEAAKWADLVEQEYIARRDDCLSSDNADGALTTARQAQTAQEIAVAIRALKPKGPQG